MKGPCRHSEGFRPEDPPRSPVAEVFRRRDGRPLPDAIDMHDCAYVDARNALIPEASLIAGKAVAHRGLSVTEPAGKWLFAREFLGAMQRLAVQVGLA